MSVIAKRLDGISEYYFSQKLREIDSLNKEGKNIINLGIGSPDLPPHPDVIKTLQEEAAKPGVHGYQGYKGIPALRQAFTDWYQRWYQVSLDPDTEVLPLIGSKEGIMHICMTYLNEGDEALIPDPGYPTYSSAVKLAGGKPVSYLLQEERNWYPDLESLAARDLSKVKLMFVNYPHMPTGQQMGPDLFENLVRFAKENQILLVHDNPYSFILNDNPVSLLKAPGAKEVVLELNSLSKSHNMAGWRIGMLCGSKERIEEVLRFKSNMDSGMFQPLQMAAAKALSLGPEWYSHINSIYAERREQVYRILDILGCSYSLKQVGLFVWAKIPDRYEDGYALSDEILYGSNVFLTPGGIFGSQGNRYIRISLCGDLSRFEQAITRISK
ncbi:aminotransferase class I/II-fold pyridoxal phosphate-dependent enzyme [Pedobacter hiemivivus]|uniref:Aminotransferase n=1 Tax=Pedobacter hiemivivus TaxID=2530454 RepID=A0A4R0N410_9SPHI|nr:aminotransferase class I/II-fold pyridoxal phosphate-dependent enzyme [Pedobacter hiemivivus]TCC94648.1 aminotransferase class I/II-fold pyridoxal phosphate-dependent enzyme [Pedobacter hiemivivus]TKC62449.1 aminotransferase class I/II-fold pyridoxal phosphate-dependent enzyme [Pedobacter hiemivivus]